MTNEVYFNELEAVSLAASTEASRYHICGILIEQYSNGATRLVATDGHRLHMITKGEVAADDMPVISATLPNAAFKKLKVLRAMAIKNIGRPNKQNLITTPMLITISEGYITISIKHVADITEAAIDGNFPDYRRVIPSNDAYENAPSRGCYNPKYLADFGKASELLGVRNCGIIVTNHNSGTGAARLEINDSDYAHFSGVVMPIKNFTK